MVIVNVAVWVKKSTVASKLTKILNESDLTGVPQILKQPSVSPFPVSKLVLLGVQSSPGGRPVTDKTFIFEMGSPAGVVESTACTGVVDLGIRKEISASKGWF